jgi:hypothetical protein
MLTDEQTDTTSSLRVHFYVLWINRKSASLGLHACILGQLCFLSNVFVTLFQQLGNAFKWINGVSLQHLHSQSFSFWKLNKRRNSWNIVKSATNPSSISSVVSPNMRRKFKYAADLQSMTKRHAAGSTKTIWNDSVPHMRAISYSGHVPDFNLFDRLI